jgi:hypothetical protein
VFAVFPSHRSFFGLFISYPISWIMVTTLNSIVLFIAFKKLKKELKVKQAAV